jgi:hypothetical protein
MTSRKRKATSRSPSSRDDIPDNWPTDDILAPNSDTECEPLSKRRKHIEEIAQYCRDGGDLYLISTSLRGPIVNNPWARKKAAVIDVSQDVVKKVVRRGKKQTKVRKTTAKGAPLVKDGKVDRYFPAQKNSQEREVVEKKQNIQKYAVEKEDPIALTYESDDTLRRADVKEMGCGNGLSGIGSPEPLRAVPRMIDFDNIPQSTAIASQNYPSLQLITTRRQSAHIIPTASDPIGTPSNESDKSEQNTDDDGGLLDVPTPEKTTVVNPKTAIPTTEELQSIRNLIGDNSQPAKVPEDPDKGLYDDPDKGLYDDPTPPKDSNPSPVEPSNSPSSGTILPASLTNRTPPSFSPINASSLKSALPKLLPLSEPVTSVLADQSNRQTRSPSRKQSAKKLIRSTSLLDPVPINSSPRLLQRSQTHNIQTHYPATPPLNTQNMLDQANQSFDAILPAVPTSNKKPMFTPFRELNTSPEHEGFSFRLSEESPLTYTPGRGDSKVEEVLWAEVKGFLGNWNLEEEVDKIKGIGDGVESSVKEISGESQSQENLAVA